MLRVQLIGILVLSIVSLFVLAIFMHGTTFYESGIDGRVTSVLAQQENSNGTMNSTDMKSIHKSNL
jgi:hypothetical protein